MPAPIRVLPFQNRRKFAETVEYAASQTKTVTLPKDQYLHGIHFYLEGIVTHTDITTAPVIYTYSPLHLLEKIEVIADSDNVLKSISGQHLAIINALHGNVAPVRTAPGLTATAHTFSSYLYLPFCIPKSLHSIDTLLNPNEFRTFQLAIDWGSGMTALFSTQPTAGTITTDPTLEVGLDRSKGGAVRRRNIYRTKADQWQVLATSSEMRIKIKGGVHLRGLFLITERVAAGLAYGDPANDILNSCRLMRGDNEIWPSRRSIEQAANAYRAELATVVTGIQYLDFTMAGTKGPDSYLSECLDLTRYDEVDLVCNVTKTSGTEYIYVIPEVVQFRASA